MPALHRTPGLHPSLFLICSLLLCACSGGGDNPTQSSAPEGSTSLSNNPLASTELMQFFADHALVLSIPEDHAAQERVFIKVATGDVSVEVVHFLGEISPVFSNGEYSVELDLNLPRSLSAASYQVFSVPTPLPVYQGQVAL